MKHLLPLLVGSMLLPVAFASGADRLAPGQVDFGKFSPPGSGAEFVEVNLPGNLISLAARLVEKQEPDVAQLLNSIKLLHVNVVGLTDENLEEVEGRMKDIKQNLTSKGWQRIVAAQKEAQDVGVYLKMGAKDVVQGLAVIVQDGKDKHAVFANLVGDINPDLLTKLGDRLAEVGDRLGVDPLKKVGHEINRSERAEKEHQKSEADEEEK